MTNVEKYEKMKSVAADTFLTNETLGRELNKKASLFAEANFTEKDFNECISSSYGYKRFILTKWKNRILQERATKK